MKKRFLRTFVWTISSWIGVHSHNLEDLQGNVFGVLNTPA